MIVRPVRPDEHDRWFAMRQILFDDCTSELLRREMAEILSEPARQVCLVAEDTGGVLVGFAEGSIRDWATGCDDPNVGYLEAWYVEVDHRRRGVGRALVDGVATWAEEKSASAFASDCVIDNEVSRKAHLALGFEEVVRLICFRRK